MADARLSVELSANIANFRAQLANAASDLNRTGAAAQVASNNITQNIGRVNAINLSAFNRSLQSGEVSLRSISAASVATSTTASRSLAQMAVASATTGRSVVTGSNQAAQALTNVGRVAQDSAFGFIGIANNLNPLLESFQRLRAETGSNRAALRALGSSLMGAGGIGLALSLVTAALQFASIGMRAWTGSVKKGKEAAEEYISTLDQLTQAQLKGAQNAQKEITELNTLYGITQNTTLSQKQRLDAVNDLQSTYPEYFKNLRDETILNGGAEQAYIKLAEAIIATARARAAQDLITKNSSRQLENEQKIADLEVKRLKEMASATKNLNTIRAGGTGMGAQGYADQAERSEKRAADLLKQQNDLRTDSNILNDRNLKLTESINEQIKKGADLTDNSAEKTGKKFKTLAEILEELRLALVINDNQFKDSFYDRNNGKISAYQAAIESLITNGFSPLSDAVERLKKQQKDLFQLPVIGLSPSANTGISTPSGNTKVSGKSNTDFFANMSEDEQRVYEAQARILLAQESFNQRFDELTKSGLAEGLSDLSMSIGDALASGANVMDAAGKSLLSSLGGMLIDLGKLAIATGIGIASVKKALQSLNPAIAIGAGVALIALGSIFRSKASQIGNGGDSGRQTGSSIPQFASGVQNFKGGMALVGERGPELVNLPTGSDVIPNGRSRNIVGRNSNAPIVVAGEMRISLGQLVVALRNEEKSMNRLG